MGNVSDSKAVITGREGIACFLVARACDPPSGASCWFLCLFLRRFTWLTFLYLDLAAVWLGGAAVAAAVELATIRLGDW